VLAIGVLLLGVYPNPLVEVMHSSTSALVEQILAGKL
jgi:NADH:ubiquinone oxidoreductase subunit 4 (subunit M)